MADSFQLDRQQLRRHFDKAAASYDSVDALARATSEQMDARLEGIVHTPSRVLDLGCGTGRDLAVLVRRYPGATCVGADLSPAMLARIPASTGWIARLISRRRNIARVAADANALPFARAHFDMVWSNLMLNWLDDPTAALREIHRVLRVDGMLMFATLGPDTLKELRQALGDAKGVHVHRFIDMHDIGDALIGAGFENPVMDMDTLTLTYPDFDTLIADLRLSGSTNASAARRRGLGGRALWQRARALYDGQRHDGRLPATFEVVYGHAWKPEPKTLEDGRAVIRFQSRASRA